jgi:hypothetical protein
VDQHPWPVLLLAFVLAGVGIGFAETHRPRWSRSPCQTAFAATGSASSDCCKSHGDLGATLVMAWLWAALSPTIAFGYLATWMSASLIATLAITNRNTTARSGP